MNGLAIEMNKQAFLWGRRTAHDRAAVDALLDGPAPEPESLDEILAARRADLVAYQDEAYAARYEALVRRVSAREAERLGAAGALATTVARNLYKLMAYKDEYEVARLYSDPAFRARIEANFEGVERLELLLAPPFLSRPDPATGRIAKRTFGPWIFLALRLLAGLKGLRGGPFDIFGRSAERREERALVTDYEDRVTGMLDDLTVENHIIAIAIAEVPATICGFGHVKQANVEAARAEWERLTAVWCGDAPLARAAE